MCCMLDMLFIIRQSLQEDAPSDASPDALQALKWLVKSVC